TSYTATCTTASSSATAVGTVTVMVPAVLSLQTSSTLVAAGTPVNLVAVGCTGTIAWSTGERVLSIVVPPTTGTNVYSATCITGPCTIATSISIQSTTACTVGLTTSSLPAGTVGQPYSATLITTGGTAPYTFSMDSNSWPTGLTLNASTGVLSGVPTTSGSFSTTLHVTDSQSCSATMPLAMLQIGTAPICSLTATVTPGLCNTASNLYTLTGTIDLSNAATGNLTVSDGSTSTVVSVAANQATASFSLTGLNSDGIVHTVSASMSGCTSTTATYTAPQSCKTTPCSSGECFPIAVERAW
ncbi:putative Ig domain-containing protein, partial [Spirosoma migulaei]